MGVTPTDPVYTTGKDNDDAKWMRMRAIETTFTSKKLGKISVGFGYNPSYGAGYTEVAKTDMASSIWVATNAGAVPFRNDDADKSSSGHLVEEAFNYVDGLFASRLMYDTPDFKGLKFAVALQHNGGWDYGLTYDRDMEKVKMQAKLGHYVPRDDRATATSNKYMNHTIGHLNFLHKSTGFNFGVTGGQNDEVANDTRNDETYWFFRAGKITGNSLGDLAASIDYWTGKNFKQNDTKSTSYGVAIAQHFKGWNAEIHASWKYFKFEDGGVGNLKPITAVLLGSRVNF